MSRRGRVKGVCSNSCGANIQQTTHYSSHNDIAHDSLWQIDLHILNIQVLNLNALAQ